MANTRLAQAPTIYDAIRLGVVDIEIAPLGTAYNAATGWERLGTIVPGSYKQEIEREKYIFERGLPKTAHKSFYHGQKGQIAFDLSEITSRAIDVQNGGLAVVRTTTDATTVSASPAPTTTTFTVASIGTIVAGSWITVVTTNYGTVVRKVRSVATAAITVDALPEAPASGAAVTRITASQVAGGGVTLQERSMRAVFVDTYDELFYWYFPKVISTGKMAFDAKDATSEAILPMEFDLFGVQSTVNGTNDVFLWHNYFIPAL